MAINTKTNTIYVDQNSIGNGSDQGEISVIDGATNTISTNIGMNRGFQPMAVNETTNTLYAINTDSTPNGFSLIVINGATNAVTATLPWLSQPNAVAVNPVTNKVYVSGYNQNSGASSVIVLDGATNTVIATVNSSFAPAELLVNTLTNTIYGVSNPVMVIDGATNTATTVAVGSGAQFGALNTVTNYIYVANYYDKTLSVINGAANGPAFTPSPSPLAFGNQTVDTTSSAKTLTVTNSGTTDLTITTVTEGGTNKADFLVGTDTCSAATVNAGKTCAVSVEFAPTTTSSETASLSFADNAPGNPHVVNFTGTGVAPVATASTTALSASATSIAVGASVTFTATVSPASGTPTPTGTVTFKDGATTLGTGTLNSSGVATYATGSLAKGAHAITASYGGDSRNLASVSTSLAVTVTSVASTTALTSSAASAVVGSSLTFTATVKGGTGAASPTGAVTFKDGSTTLGTGAVNASGVATYTTTTLAAGSHSITASYAGDTNNAASVSSSVAVTIWPGPPDFTMELSPGSGSFKAGKPATVTITVTSVNGFNAAATLTCGTLPKNTVCTFSSSSITPDVSGTATSTLTITTDKKPAAAVTQAARAGHAPLRDPFLSAGAALALILFPLFGARNRKLRRMLMALSCLGILAVVISTGIAGCGGGPTTPKGNYSIQITGAAGSASHSATYSLTVQ